MLTTTEVEATPNSLRGIAPNFIRNLNEQAETPPSGDVVMGACYRATVELLNEDPAFNGLIADVLDRRDISPSHFSNILFRGFQFLEVFRENNADYPEDPRYRDKGFWKERIVELMGKHGAEFSAMMEVNNTVTTIADRYLGEQIVLAALFGDRDDLRFADFGCGGNFGLRAMAQGIPFNAFEDQTRDGLATVLATQQLKMAEGLAVDMFDPYDPKNVQWRWACSFYAKELKTGLPKLRQYESQLGNPSQVRFMQGNLLTLEVNHREGTLRKKHYDAIFINTMLYQMDDTQRAKILQSARECLREGGVIIVQDFARKNVQNPKDLDFNPDYFAKQGMYRTFVVGDATNWEFKEALIWDSGRCKKVKEGEDFSFLLGL